MLATALLVYIGWNYVQIARQSDLNEARSADAIIVFGAIAAQFFEQLVTCNWPDEGLAGILIENSKRIVHPLDELSLAYCAGGVRWRALQIEIALRSLELAAEGRDVLARWRRRRR